MNVVFKLYPASLDVPGAGSWHWAGDYLAGSEPVGAGRHQVLFQVPLYLLLTSALMFRRFFATTR
jgi:hypothetical protein